MNVIEKTIAEFAEFLKTEQGAQYIARRVRVGSTQIDAELRALDLWLEWRNLLNHSR